jgi:transcriptional regulator with XRE-family HTH domain
MTTVREQLRRNLQTDRAYRKAFVCEHVDQNIPFQIRANREHRGWTQADLGKRARMAQARISVLEDPNYSKFTISTLKRLAAAFDTGLQVAFVPVSAVMNRSVNLANHLVSPSADEDPGLNEESEGAVNAVGGVPLAFELDSNSVSAMPFSSLTVTLWPIRQPSAMGSIASQLLQPRLYNYDPRRMTYRHGSQRLGTATHTATPTV